MDIAHASGIQRAFHDLAALVQHLRVDHRRTHVVVAEQFLHRTDVVARFEQVRCETVPETIARRAIRWPGRPSEPLRAVVSVRFTAVRTD